MPMVFLRFSLVFSKRPRKRRTGFWHWKDLVVPKPPLSASAVTGEAVREVVASILNMLFAYCGDIRDAVAEVQGKKNNTNSNA